MNGLRTNYLLFIGAWIFIERRMYTMLQSCYLLLFFFFMPCIIYTASNNVTVSTVIRQYVQTFQHFWRSHAVHASVVQTCTLPTGQRVRNVSRCALVLCASVFVWNTKTANRRYKRVFAKASETKRVSLTFLLFGYDLRTPCKNAGRHSTYAATPYGNRPVQPLLVRKTFRHPESRGNAHLWTQWGRIWGSRVETLPPKYHRKQFVFVAFPFIFDVFFFYM